MNKTTITSKNASESIKPNLLYRAYNFVKNNPGFVTLLISFLSFFIPGLINFFIFIKDIGIALRFNISIETIFPYSDNAFNYIFILSFCHVIYLLILFFIYKSIELIESRIIVKFVYCIFILILNAFFIYVFVMLFTPSNIIDIINLIVLSIIIFILLILLFSPAYYYKRKHLDHLLEINNCKISVIKAFKYILKQVLLFLKIIFSIISQKIKAKIKKTNYEKLDIKIPEKYFRFFVTCFLILFVIFSLISYSYSSYCGTMQRQEYTIVNYHNTFYAVIYESYSQFLITSCTIDNTNGIITFKEENNNIFVNKENIEFFKLTLTPQFTHDSIT